MLFVVAPLYAILNLLILAVFIVMSTQPLVLATLNLDLLVLIEDIFVEILKLWIMAMLLVASCRVNCARLSCESAFELTNAGS